VEALGHPLGPSSSSSSSTTTPLHQGNSSSTTLSCNNNNRLVNKMDSCETEHQRSKPSPSIISTTTSATNKSTLIFTGQSYPHVSISDGNPDARGGKGKKYIIFFEIESLIVCFVKITLYYMLLLMFGTLSH
jgi:hypothetical protein